MLWLKKKIRPQFGTFFVPRALALPLSVLSLTGCIETAPRTPSVFVRTPEPGINDQIGTGSRRESEIDNPHIPGRDANGNNIPNTNSPGNTPDLSQPAVASNTPAPTQRPQTTQPNPSPTAIPQPVVVVPAPTVAAPSPDARPATATPDPVPVATQTVTNPTSPTGVVPIPGCADTRFVFDRVNSTVTLRKTPEFKETNLFAKKANCTPVCLVSKADGWASIKTEDGNAAFVDVTRVIYPEDDRCPNAIAPPNPPASLPCATAVKVFDPATTSVNLRSKPNETITEKISNCTIVCKVAAEGNWMKVTTTAGKQGYIFSTLLISAKTRCP